MSLTLILACLWVIAATLTAFLPMRRQMIPGLALLIAAPILLGFIGAQYGWLYFVAGLLAFLSMFRNPLKYLVRRAISKPQERPE